MLVNHFSNWVSQTIATILISRSVAILMLFFFHRRHRPLKWMKCNWSLHVRLPKDTFQSRQGLTRRRSETCLLSLIRQTYQTGNWPSGSQRLTSYVQNISKPPLPPATQHALHEGHRLQLLISMPPILVRARPGRVPHPGSKASTPTEPPAPRSGIF